MSASKAATRDEVPVKKGDATAKRVAAKKVAAKKVAAKKVTAKKAPPSATPAKRHRVFGVSFASLYPLYVKKVESKGRTRAELDEVIAWLTGWKGAPLARVIETKVDLEGFYATAPRMNPNAGLITGLVCGVRVEEVADPVMRKIRMLDKLVDELAKGKTMSKILREPPAA